MLLTSWLPALAFQTTQGTVAPGLEILVRDTEVEQSLPIQFPATVEERAPKETAERLQWPCCLTKESNQGNCQAGTAP